MPAITKLTRTCLIRLVQTLTHSSLLTSEHRALKFTKCSSVTLAKTLGICTCMLLLGLTQHLAGPSLLHMELLLGTDTQGMAAAYTAEQVGGFLGSLLTGLYFDRYNWELQFSLGYYIIAVLAFATPWMPSLSTFTAIIFARTLVMYYCFASSYGYLLRLWTGDPYQNIVAQISEICWGVGSLVGPLIVVPFLSELPPQLKQETADGIRDAVKEVDVDMNGVARVRYPYMIGAFMYLALALLFTGIYLSSPVETKTTESSTGSKLNKKMDTATNDLPGSRVIRNHLYKILVALTFVLILFLVMISTGVAIYVSVFAIKQLGWSANNAAYLVSLCRASQTVSAIVAIYLSLHIQPNHQLLINCMFGVLAFTTMQVAVTGVHSDKLMSLSIAFVGCFVSNSYIIAIVWAAQYLTVQASFGVIFSTGTTMGRMASNAIMGYLLHNYSPMSFVYILQLLFALYILTFAILNCLVRVNRKDNEKVERQSVIT